MHVAVVLVCELDHNLDYVSTGRASLCEEGGSRAGIRGLLVRKDELFRLPWSRYLVK